MRFCERAMGPTSAEIVASRLSRRSVLSMSANDGRTFAKTSAVPRGAQTMLPFDAPPGVVELQVRRIEARFEPDGSIGTIFPVAY